MWRKPEAGRSTPPVEAVPPATLHDAVPHRASVLDRAHQHAAIAALGQQALMGKDLGALLEHAAIFSAQTLSVEFTAIYQMEDGEAIRMMAGYGWPGQFIGQCTVRADAGSMARHVFDSSEPVIVRDLSTASRFDVPMFLIEFGVISLISVAVRGPRGIWGLIEAGTCQSRRFGEEDFHYLQSVANIISTAYARQQTEKENAKLAAFAQHNPNPVLEFAAHGELTYFNEATRQMTASLHRQHPLELLPPDVKNIIESTLQSGANLLDVQTEVAGRTIAWSFFPISAIRCVHAYAVDVTERLNLEAQLRQAQKMEAVGQLAAGVAHDFNNILTIIQGLADRLGQRTIAGDRETLQQLSDTAQRAAALTRQLLAFSRRQVMQTRIIDLRDVVTGVSRMLQRLIGEDIVLTVENASALPAIEADASMMEQILMNLAVNARDAMPRGGHLLIQTELTHKPDLCGEEKPFVCLRVSDSGCGMSEEVRARIFEPFFTTKDIGKGTGLGLATVFGIVKQHGGSIEVDSAVDQGTTFSIFLPGSDQMVEVKTQQPEPASPSSQAGGETILLVEDEPLLRELAQAILSAAGYRVLEAGEGSEAFTVWRDHEREIDLLLTDMVLPGGITGRELAVELRRSKPDLKVIYTTGYSPDMLDGGMQPGHFLQKPYPPESLTRTVRACLDA